MMRLLLLIAFCSLIQLNVYGQKFSANYFDGQIYFKIKNEVELPAKYLSDKAEISDFGFLEKVMERYEITKLRSSFYFAKDENIRRVFRVYFNKSEGVEEFINYLKTQTQVEYAEKVPLHKTSLTPNDLGANNTGSSGQWGLHKIRAQQAWDISTGSSSIKVAIVDDAVQTTHPDLNDACIAGRDVADNDNDPNPPNNTFDHGTHVAGIVGAETNNGTGIASIGFGVSIIPVKSTNDAEFITDGYEGVVWAIDNDADVINMSWGGSGGSQTGQNIMNSGNNAGVVLVAASGNDDVSTTFYPAGFNHVISVASTSSSDAKSSFSNYGSWIDISAPGSSIRSTVPTTGYSSKSGTSMASPLVAGLCGLMLSANPVLTPQEVLECLQLTADNINSQNANYIGQLGGGRINAEAALECASASALAFDAGVINIISPSGSTCNATFQPVISIRNTGQSSISSLLITYQLNSQNPESFVWNGNLTSQNSQLVTLPEITGVIGNHTLTICSSTINGTQVDGFSGNNCKTMMFSIVSPIGIALPFNETFESGNFSANGWTVNNPDSGLGWEVITTTGTSPGNKSARIPFFSYSATGQRDALITPTLNFSAYTDLVLSFDHSYRRYQSGISDSLIVSVSTDCGETYPNRIFIGGENGQGSFATATISTTDFVPASADDWCNGPVGADCSIIDLNAFAGLTGIRIKFEGYNNYGNNLYLDNINIDGTIAGAAAVADFTVAGSSTICEGEEVIFTNLSGNQPGSYQWTFSGGTPASSNEVNPTIAYQTPGVYQVSLLASNIFGQDTEVKTNFIVVEAAPALSIAANPSEICKGTPTTLTGFGAVDYQWSPVIAISSTSGETITANPSQTTTYTLTGTSLAGCEASTNFTLVVNELPDQPLISISNGILTSSEGFSYQWYLNNELIAGANSQSYEPVQEGLYFVEVTNVEGCSRKSNGFNFDNSVGIQTLAGQKLRLFPNPANEFIRVEGLDSFEYLIYQSNGQLVHKGLSLNGIISIRDFSTGLYFVQIIHENQAFVEQIVISSELE